MAESHGSKATLTLNGQDVTVYANTLGISASRDTGETTTMGKTSRTYIPGLKDATLPFEGPYNDDADAILWPLFDSGDIVDFAYRPAGATGPVFTGRCFVTGFEVSSDVSDPNSFSSGMQVTGDVERAAA